MAAGTNRNVARIAFIAVAIPILIAVWVAAPYFLPVYRWMNVDYKKLAAQTGLTEQALATQFKMRVRFNPRGEGDPLPWQIIDCQPPYHTIDPKTEDETEILVRCTFVSGNDGKPKGTMFINGTFQDRYWTVTGLRLPPGSLGFNAKRTVVVYDDMSLNKMEIGQADTTRMEIGQWENDDGWRSRDDGFITPNKD